jgi:hypothetical protein
MIDKATGQELLFKPDHSLFFIKMQYWAFVIGATGVFLLLGCLFQQMIGWTLINTGCFRC